MLLCVEAKGLQKWTTNEYLIHFVLGNKPFAIAKPERPGSQM